ncbi:PASTA domain-containing protein [Lutibacter sp. B1]|uniref:PASTA domain-containing protein n=1 Tax=Lutibacter sp. B1 TaxID=2725996 RepID=UPI001456D3FD|nr:PASTA domain-containing protein [Lutibacter sp. B1]NLP57578.1 PASTA domain-containing protein [Lutibacter sp. B1]
MSLVQFIKSKTFLKQLLFAVIGLIVVAFIVMKWLNISTNHSQKIEVPNLERLSIDEVENKLDDLDLNYVVIDSTTYNPSFPKKSVIEQSPEAGDFVKENRKIYLTLNPSGYADVEIPDFYGKTKRQAISQLKAIGFRISDDFMYVSDIAEDVVRGLKFNGKDLKAGDKVPKNSLIILKLGDGNGAGRFSQTSEE